MNIGILGTGTVGTTLGDKLVRMGHSIKMGSRSAANEKAIAWVRLHEKSASQGTFAEAAAFGEIIFNCTSGMKSLEALQQAGAENLRGKILIDVANPLDFSIGMPPSLSVCNTDSLGEQIQRAFPDTKVVKTLNTVNASVMINPALVPGNHDLFICGNDPAAKTTVVEFLQREFGWKSVIDLGDMAGARATEMWLPLWLRLYTLFQTPNFNIHVVK
jgi:predicted dinucleotide-binding enzyme